MSNTTNYNGSNGKPIHHYHHQPLDAKTDTAISMFSGALAGVISRTATAPFDRVKTLMQMGRGVPLRPPGITKSEYVKRYGMFRSSKSGVAAAARSIYTEGGWRGFFRGNGTNVVKVIPDEALKYSVKRRITEYITGDPDHATLLQHIVAGALSGAVSQTLIYPLEITKTRMTVAGANEYKGILDCIMNTLKVEGVNGFYKGFVPNILGIIPFQGVYFGLFFFLTDRFEEANGCRPDKPTQFAYSTLASSMSILVSYPLNLVRTKLQTQGVNGRPILYEGMKDCITKTVEHEGYRGLYRGLVPNYFKALPTLTMSLMLIKATSDFLRSMVTGPPPFVE